MARKILSVALIVIMLAGCGTKEEGVKEEATNTDPVADPVAAPVAEEDETAAAADTQNDSFEVDKGLLSVTVTVPASMLDGSDEDSIIADAKEKGYEDVTVNEDGSATYKMSKSVYNKLLKETEDTVIKTINETVIGEDFPSIKNVAHNNKLTAFTITVDRDAYENGFDGIALLGIYFTASFYQVFDGKTVASATFDIVDDSTGKVFKTINYPDDLNM